MYKIKSKFISDKIDNLKDQLNRPEIGYWQDRLAKKRFTWPGFWYLLPRFVVWVIVFILLLFFWFAKDLPTPGKIKNVQSATSTQLFDRNNQPIYSFQGDVRRTTIDSASIPLTVKEATVAAEDHNFYHHFGIDFRGLARAVINDVLHRGGLQGGSTITQQYVKNALLDPTQRTLTRKIKEAFLSVELEIMFSKDQILTMYINEIPYGSGAYGIEAASGTYFGKHAKDLTLAESATLAALPQRPTYLSPYGTHPDARIARVNYILDSMVSLNYISKDEVDKAKEEAKTVNFSAAHEYIVAPHFVQYVKDLLVKKYGEQMVDEGGLKVVTSLDLGKQTIAEDVIKKAATGPLKSINASNAALVSIDPKTGQILAMVGSADYFNNDIDGQVNVADSLRQPGSSFKPVVYATAFKGKYNPAYVLWDVSTNFNNYIPKNYDGSYHGPVTMRSALDGSLNIPAVKTLALAGVNNAINTAHDMGITSINEPARYGLSLVLGGAEVKLVDLTTAYGVFANNGNLAPTTPILKVMDKNGKVLQDNTVPPSLKKALDPQIAYEINSILSDDSARAYVFGAGSSLHLQDRPAAAKTGTTTDFRDAWTLGYTPSLVAGVWVGNNDNSTMKAGSEGAMAAAPIWHQYMEQALANTPAENFVRPSGITDVTVDKMSNLLPSANSPETVTDVFASWQVPTTQDNIHQVVRIDKASGLPAKDSCPAVFTENKYFTNLHSEQPNNPAWEKPVLAAAASFGINVGTAPLATDKTACAQGDNSLGVNITSPKDGSANTSSVNVKVSVKGKHIQKVDLFVDGQNVGTDTASPYIFSLRKLTGGDHSISAVTTDTSGTVSSDSIKINVNGGAPPADNSTDTNPPGTVTNVEIQTNVGAAIIKWNDPSDSDLKSINIYQSDNQGDLGSVAGSVNATPATGVSVTVNNLTSGQTYWFTLRAVDASGNENTDSTQYQVTVL